MRKADFPEDCFEYFAWKLFDATYDDLTEEQKDEVKSHVDVAENDD